jgi:hypothetical protein
MQRARVSRPAGGSGPQQTRRDLLAPPEATTSEARGRPGSSPPVARRDSLGPVVPLACPGELAARPSRAATCSPLPFEFNSASQREQLADSAAADGGRHAPPPTTYYQPVLSACPTCCVFVPVGALPPAARLSSEEPRLTAPNLARHDETRRRGKEETHQGRDEGQRSWHQEIFNKYIYTFTGFDSALIRQVAPSSKVPCDA